LIAQAVFLLKRGHTHTHRETHRIHSDWSPIPMLSSAKPARVASYYNIYFDPERGMKHCHERLCLSVCPSVGSHMSETVVATFCIHVT